MGISIVDEVSVDHDEYVCEVVDSRCARVQKAGNYTPRTLVALGG